MKDKNEALYFVFLFHFFNNTSSGAYLMHITFSFFNREDPQERQTNGNSWVYKQILLTRQVSQYVMSGSIRKFGEIRIVKQQKFQDLIMLSEVLVNIRRCKLCQKGASYSCLDKIRFNTSYNYLSHSVKLVVIKLKPKFNIWTSLLYLNTKC